MLIRLIPTNSSRGILAYWLKCTCRCQSQVWARDEQELDWAREDVARQGAAVLPLVCDVADRDQVDHAVEEATRHFGRVDILVNNAGTIQVGPMPTATVQDFEDALGVMFWGALYPTLAVLPQMRARRSGRIVNITHGSPISKCSSENCSKYGQKGSIPHPVRTKIVHLITNLLPSHVWSGNQSGTDFEPDFITCKNTMAYKILQTPKKMGEP